MFILDMSVGSPGPDSFINNLIEQTQAQKDAVTAQGARLAVHAALRGNVDKT